MNRLPRKNDKSIHSTGDKTKTKTKSKRTDICCTKRIFNYLEENINNQINTSKEKGLKGNHLIVAYHKSLDCYRLLLVCMLKRRHSLLKTCQTTAHCVATQYPIASRCVVYSNQTNTVISIFLPLFFILSPIFGWPTESIQMQSGLNSLRFQNNLLWCVRVYACYVAYIHRRGCVWIRAYLWHQGKGHYDQYTHSLSEKFR